MQNVVPGGLFDVFDQGLRGWLLETILEQSNISVTSNIFDKIISHAYCLIILWDVINTVFVFNNCKSFSHFPVVTRPSPRP